MRAALILMHILPSPHVEYPLKLGKDAVLVADPLEDPLLLSLPVEVAVAPLLALVLVAADEDTVSLVDDCAATKEHALDTTSNSDSGKDENMTRVQQLVKELRWGLQRERRES